MSNIVECVDSLRKTSERSTDEAIDVLAESTGRFDEEFIESEEKVHG